MTAKPTSRDLEFFFTQILALLEKIILIYGSEGSIYPQQWKYGSTEKHHTVCSVCWSVLHKFVCCVLQKWQKLGDVLNIHHSNWSNALHDSIRAVLYNIIILWLMNNSIFSSDSVFLLLKGQHFHKSTTEIGNVTNLALIRAAGPWGH